MSCFTQPLLRLVYLVCPMEHRGFKVSQDCDTSAVLLLSLKEATGRWSQSSQQQISDGHECRFQNVLPPCFQCLMSLGHFILFGYHSVLQQWISQVILIALSCMCTSSVALSEESVPAPAPPRCIALALQFSLHRECWMDCLMAGSTRPPHPLALWNCSALGLILEWRPAKGQGMLQGKYGRGLL